MTMNQNPERPIRVVMFGGPYLESSALRFAVMLAEHPDIELLAGLCQGKGAGMRHRLANLWHRRGALALPVLMLEAGGALLRLARQPRDAISLRRRASRALARFVTVPDVHAPEVLQRVRELEPDLGLIYGAPVLKPALFEIPALGTLGIHHGKVPEYRGKKTTFWAMYYGERTAGVTIQRVSAGIDTGDVVQAGEVEIGSKSYARVEREIEELGLALYLRAVLDMKEGRATFRPQHQPTPKVRSYRQPSARDIGRFWLRRLLGQPPSGQAPVRSRSG
jgi:folate-dependent phosphoribosylglycinamide formyltransferase PurN